MFKIKHNKIFLIAIFIFINLFFVNKTFAVNLQLESPKKSLGIGEQFYVDLVLNTEGQAVNTIKGSVSFYGEAASFVRLESNRSILNLWLEEPTLNNNTISFTGVIPNGYEGTIDPFNPSKKISGQIMRMVFEAKKVGRIDFSTVPFYLNLNDGLGTEINTPSAFLSLSVDNFTYNYKYDGSDESLPEIEAYVTRDQNIFNNKYILIFNATDKGSGIKSVTLKEGWRGWKEVKSPYLLRDQSRHSDIIIQATSNSGASVVLKINKIPSDYRCLVLILILFIILFLLYEKRSNKKKKIEKNTGV